MGALSHKSLNKLEKFKMKRSSRQREAGVKGVGQHTPSGTYFPAIVSPPFGTTLVRLVTKGL